ncbi:MAG TPA: hypothetical protein VFY23_00015 [Candidatus Limnocylindrales bacterium]|nr:hypothetical protein [Candidatus Limnocylindrales bacterium]
MTEEGGRRGSGEMQPQEKTPAPEQKPSGDLGGQPINADETAPREHVPEPPAGGAPAERDPEAVDDEPGSDL